MNRYHQEPPKKKPGLLARERQLAATLREGVEVGAESRDVNRAITGNVSTREDIARARRALKRQQRAGS